MRRLERLRFTAGATAILTIIVAALIAHSRCLGAIFYLDDWNQIIDSDFVASGKWWDSGVNALTVATYWLTWRIAGFSAPAFHAGNLALHTAFAVCIYYCSGVFLQTTLAPNESTRRGIALLAAIIFAVHPLGSEITNYARARDHELVGFFSFVVAVTTLLWIHHGWRWFPALVACTLAATFSKGPGVWHAAYNIVVTLLCFATAADWRGRFSSRWIVYSGLGAFSGLIAIYLDRIITVIALPFTQLHDWRFGWHLLTQSRVIWQYVWRMIIPVDLCSDHLIAWTRSLSDVMAWIGVAGVLCWIGVTVWLWARARRFEAFLSAMILGPLLLRFAYVVSELMVEYRTYPALPWLGLLFAVVIFRSCRAFPRVAFICATVVVISFAVLAHLRSTAWRNSDRLFADILTKYPLQLRAYNGLSDEDLRARRFGAVLQRAPQFFAKLDLLLKANRCSPTRYYDIWPLCVVAEECNITDALLATKGSAAAREYLLGVGRRMKSNGIRNEDLWALWNFELGKVELREGNRPAAEGHFAFAAMAGISRSALERTRKEWSQH
jgi:hypothetical protein